MTPKANAAHAHSPVPWRLAWGVKAGIVNVLSSTRHRHPFSGRTSGTPNRGCPADRLDESSASVRCSGNGRHAVHVLLARPCLYVLRADDLTLQMPHATVHSSLVVEPWLAWQSIQRSMMWLRQMAQLSTTMSHAQRATAFHYMNVSATQPIQCLAYVQAIHTFLTSNFFFPSATSPLAPALAFLLTLGAAPASVISTSAMVVVGC